MRAPFPCRRTKYSKPGELPVRPLNQSPDIFVRLWKGGGTVEYPELDFLQYLLRRFVENEELDPAKCTIQDLIDRLLQELIPIGGG